MRTEWISESWLEIEKSNYIFHFRIFIDVGSCKDGRTLGHNNGAVHHENQAIKMERIFENVFQHKNMMIDEIISC